MSIEVALDQGAVLALGGAVAVGIIVEGDAFMQKGMG